MVKSAGKSKALVFEKHLAAPPKDAFKAFTDAAMLALWFGPRQDMSTVVHDLDARIGGDCRLDTILPDGTPRRLLLTFQKIRQPELLEFSWTEVGGPDQSIVRVEFTARRGGTDVTLSHDELDAEEARKVQAQMWLDALDRLAQRIGKMEPPRPDLDGRFRAMADPTRRAMISRLTQGEATVGELAGPHDISLPAISKHVAVLEAAGMVRRWRDGRVHKCRLEPGAFSGAEAWLTKTRSDWDRLINAPIS